MDNIKNLPFKGLLQPKESNNDIQKVNPEDSFQGNLQPKEFNDTNYDRYDEPSKQIEQEAFNNTYNDEIYISKNNNEKKSINELDDADWYNKIFTYKNGKLAGKTEDNVVNPMIPILDTESGKYYLKQINGDKKSIEQAHGSIVSAFGPKKYSTNFTEELLKGLTGNTVLQGLNNPLGLKSSLLNFAEATTDLTEASTNFLRGNGFKSEEGLTDKLAGEQRLNDQIYKFPTSYSSDKGIGDSEGLGQMLGSGGESILQFGALGRVMNIGSKALGTATLEASLAEKGIATAASRGATAEALNAYKTSRESLGKLANGFTKSASMVRNLPNFGAGAIINLGEGYEAAKQAGVSEEDAATIGLATGIINSLVETGLGTNTLTNFLTGAKDNLKIIPNAIIKNVGGDFSEAALNKATPNILAEVYDKINKYTNTTASNRIGQAVKSGLEEGREEFIQTYVNKSAEVLYDNLSTDEKAKFGTEFNKETFKEAFSSAAIGFILGSAGGTAAYNSNNIKKDILPEVRKGNEELLKQAVELGFNEGKYTSEQKDFIIQNIDDLSKEWNTNKDAYTTIPQLEKYDQVNKTNKVNELHEAMFDEIVAKKELEKIKSNQVNIIDETPETTEAAKIQNKKEIDAYNTQLGLAKEKVEKAKTKSKTFLVDENGNIPAITPIKTKSTNVDKLIKATNSTFRLPTPEKIDKGIETISNEINNVEQGSEEHKQLVQLQTDLVDFKLQYEASSFEFGKANDLIDNLFKDTNLQYKNLDSKLIEIEKQILNAPKQSTKAFTDYASEKKQEKIKNFKTPTFKGKTFFQKPFEKGTIYERINDQHIIKYNLDDNGSIVGQPKLVYKGDDDFISENNAGQIKGNRRYITGLTGTSENTTDINKVRKELTDKFGDEKIVVNLNDIGGSFETEKTIIKDINPEDLITNVKFEFKKFYAQANKFVRNEFQTNLGRDLNSNWKDLYNAGLLILSSKQIERINRKEVTYAKVLQENDELVAYFDGLEISFQNPIVKIETDGSVTNVNFKQLTIENLKDVYVSYDNKEFTEDELETIKRKGEEHEALIERLKELGTSKINSYIKWNITTENNNKNKEVKNKPSELKGIYKVNNQAVIFRGTVSNPINNTINLDAPVGDINLDSKQFFVLVKTVDTNNKPIYKPVLISTISEIPEIITNVDEQFYTNFNTEIPFRVTKFGVYLDENKTTEAISNKVQEEKRIEPKKETLKEKLKKEQEENEKKKQDDPLFSLTPDYYNEWENQLLNNKLATVSYYDAKPYYKYKYLNKKEAFNLKQRLEQLNNIQFTINIDQGRRNAFNPYFYITPYDKSLTKQFVDKQKVLASESNIFKKDETINERLFAGSKQSTAKEILEKLSKTSLFSPLAKRLVSKLNNNTIVKLVTSEEYQKLGYSVDARGLFDPNINTIFILDEAYYSKGNADNVVLHEILHSITHSYLKENDKAKLEFENLYNYVLTKLDKDDYYALTNIDEFLVGIFTDAGFIKALQSLESIKKSKFTLWDDVKDFFKNLFNVKEVTLFDDVFEQATLVIENANEFTGTNDNILYSLLPTKINKDGKQEYFSTNESNQILNTIIAKVINLYNNEENTKDILSLIDEELNNYENRYDPDKAEYNNLNNFLKSKLLDKYNAFSNSKNREAIKKATYDKIQSLYNISEYEQEVEATKDEFGDRYDLSYENIGGVDSLSKFARQYLQLTTYNEKDEFGNDIEVAIDANNVYNILERGLAYSFTQKDFIIKLKYLAKYNKSVKEFYNRFANDVDLINNAPTKNFNIFNTIFTNFAKYKVDYQFITEEDKLVNKNRSEAKSFAYSNLLESFENKLQSLSTPKPIFNTFQKISNLFNNIKEDEIPKQTLEIKKLLNEVGLNFPESYLALSLFNHIKPNLTNQENIDLVNSYDGVFLLNQTTVNLFRDELKDKNLIQANLFVPLKNESVTRSKVRADLLDISESYTLFDDTYTSSSFKNAEGNSVFNYQFGSFNITKTYELQQFFKKFAKSNLETAINKINKINPFYKTNNDFLKDNIYYKNPELLTNLKIERIDGFKDLPFADFQEVDHLRMQQTLSTTLVNKNGLKPKAGEQLYNYNYIKVLEASNTADIMKLPFFDYQSNIKQFVDDVYNYYNQQLKRIKQVEKEVAQIEKGTFKGELIKDYNIGKLRGLKVHLGLDPIIEETLLDKSEKEVKEIIKSEFQKQVSEYLNTVKTLIDQDEKLDRTLLVNGFLNNYVQTIYMYQLHHGDLAKSFKDDIDLVKRFKGSNGSMKPYSLEGTHKTLVVKDPKFYINTKTLQGYNTKPEDMTDIVEMDKSDAQTWGTIGYEMFTLNSLGEVNEKIKTLLTKISNGEKLTKEEFWGENGLNVLGVVLNPKKDLVVSEQEYQKTSRFTLTKELTSYKDSEGVWQPKKEYKELHRLREFMEVNNVAKIQPESASKMAKVDVGDISNLDVKNSHDVLNKYSGRQVENPSGKNEIIDPTQLIYVLMGELYQTHLANNDLEAAELAKQTIDKYDEINSLIRKQKFDEIYKTITDESGNVKLDQFIQKSLISLKQSGSADQLITFFEDYNLNLPTTVTKAEQLFFAYFKEAFSIKVKGNKSTFVSDYGFNVIRNVETGEIIDTESYYDSPTKTNTLLKKIYNNEYIVDNLQFRNKDGYTEILIPRNDPRLESVKIGQLINSDILTGIGTRIPHQDKHSMGIFKVVGFLPTFYGSTVVVPSQIHYLAGSDFDVDSWFMEFYDFNNKFEKIESIENDLLQTKIDLYQQTPDSIRHSPSTQDSIKEVTKDFPKEDFGNVFSITGKLKSFIANATGKRNIGIVANANIIYQMLSKYQIPLQITYQVKNFQYVLDEKGNRIISFPGYIEIKNTRYDGFNKLKDISGLRIQDNISTFISAMTDNAKDRQAAIANLTLETLNSATTLLMLGVDVRTTIMLMKSIELGNTVETGFTFDEADNIVNQVSKISYAVSNLNSVLQLVKSLNPAIKDNLGIEDKIRQLYDTENKIVDLTTILEDPLVKTNINNFMQVMNLTSQVFITESDLYKNVEDKFINPKAIFSYYKNELGLTTAEARNRTAIEVERKRKSILQWLYSNMYKKISNKEPDSNILFNDNDKSIYKQYKNALITNPNNLLLRYIQFDDNLLKQGINKIQFNTFIKLSKETQNKLTDSYQELLFNDSSKQFAIDLVNYMYTKDSFAFRDNTLLKVIDPIMFKRISQGLDSLVNQNQDELTNEIITSLQQFESVKYNNYFIPYAFRFEDFVEINNKFVQLTKNEKTTSENVLNNIFPIVMSETNQTPVEQDVDLEDLNDVDSIVEDYEYDTTMILLEDIIVSENEFTINNLEGYTFNILDNDIFVNNSKIATAEDPEQFLNEILSNKSLSQIEQYFNKFNIKKQTQVKDMCP